MITKKTVLVLGAGASMPYGFPSGEVLTDTISSQCQHYTRSMMPAVVNPNHVPKILDENCGFSIKEINVFGYELTRSHVMSIDLFLERRPEFQPIGKCAIVIELALREHLSKLRPVKTPNGDSENWYQFFLHNLLDKCKTIEEAIANNNLSVVTFNYDRSLEACFLDAIEGHYKPTYSKASEALKKLNITHLHGQLGKLFPTSEGAKQVGRPFSPTINNIDDLREFAIKEIKIVSEAHPETEEFQKARSLLNEADKVCFMGFGYGSDNTERLTTYKGAKVINTADVLGTAINFSDMERDLIKDKYFPNTIKFYQCGCRKFLSESAALW